MVDRPSEDQQLFRKVMGRFATGVTVISTALGDEIHAMTANAFMAGSLDPPLCVVCISHSSQMHERLRAYGHYGVSFLSDEQQHLSGHFAGQHTGHMHPEFTFQGPTPILNRALATLTAEIASSAECGDHTLFIGRIGHMHAAGLSPLLFYAGRYARIDRAHVIEELEPPAFW